MITSLPKKLEEERRQNSSTPLSIYETIESQQKGINVLISKVNEEVNISPDTKPKLLEKLNDIKSSLENASILALTNLKTTTMNGGKRSRKRSLTVQRGGDNSSFTIYNYIQFFLHGTVNSIKFTNL